MREDGITQLTLAKAQTIITAALAHARESSRARWVSSCWMRAACWMRGLLDARGVLKAFAAEDGIALRRADIAIGKAHGALGVGCFTAWRLAVVLSFITLLVRA